MALAVGFASAARRYWLGVFPRVCCEVRDWRRRAEEIPDPVLRQAALSNLHAERMNLDGAAAFAVFVPERQRAAVIRAQVAFQVAYDYVDTLAEQPSADPMRNGGQLHRALGAALDPAAPQVDYYAYHPYCDDAGYLEGIVETCRAALRALPSYASVAAFAQRAVARLVSYQSLNLNESQGDQTALERWARAQTHTGADLRWWEIAASAGSSISIFVLIAAAASGLVRADETIAIEEAYFPWIGSLHTLLDSLVDKVEDAAAGQHSLLDYYSSPEEAAARIRLIAAESLRVTRMLPRGGEHVLVLAGMTSHYLSTPEASLPEALLTTRGVLGTMGGLAIPTMLVMAARRAAGRLADGRRVGIGNSESGLVQSKILPDSR
jgi:tetraprenyl-beta-curcumene synthase